MSWWLKIPEVNICIEIKSLIHIQTIYVKDTIEFKILMQG